MLRYSAIDINISYYIYGFPARNHAAVVFWMAKLDSFLPKNKGTGEGDSIVNNDTPVVLPFNSQKQTRQEKRKKINLIWLKSTVSMLDVIVVVSLDII